MLRYILRRGKKQRFKALPLRSHQGMCVSRFIIVADPVYDAMFGEKLIVPDRCCCSAGYSDPHTHHVY